MKCRVVAEQSGAQSVHKQLYDHILKQRSHIEITGKAA
jgi:hypothetical protein